MIDQFLISKGEEAQFMGKYKQSMIKNKTGSLQSKVEEISKDVIFIVGHCRFYAFRADTGKVPFASQ